MVLQSWRLSRAAHAFEPLSIDSIAATETEWDTLTAAFTALGGELGAKLAREDEF